MVVMRIGLDALGPADRCSSASTILVTLTVFILGFPTFRSRLHRRFYKELVSRVLIIMSRNACVRELGLHARGGWARDADTAYTASYAGEHTAELTLDPRLTRGAMKQWLYTLDSLRQWRHPSLTVGLLDAEESPLMSDRRWPIIHNTRPTRLKVGRTRYASIRN